MSEPTLSFAVQTHRVQFVVPSEMIKKNIKTIQKQIEKSKKQVADEMSKIKKSCSLTPEVKLTMVKRLIKTYEQLHKRLKIAVERDQEYRLRLAYRARRLNQLREYTTVVPASNKDENDCSTDGKDQVLDLHNENLISWYRDETNLLIIDYLLKSNTKRETNLGLELLRRLDKYSSSKLSKLLDLDVYTSYNRVLLSISEEHDLEAVSTWYNENKVALKKIGSNLLFEIHYCKYLSLIEHGDPLEAIAYSKKNLAPYARKEYYGEGEDHVYEKNLKRLIQLGSPLVYISLLSPMAEDVRTSLHSRGSLIARSLISKANASESIQHHQFDDIQSDEHWHGLSRGFTKDFTKVYGIPQTYPLFVYLSAGLSSLKTKSCFCNSENTIFNAYRSGDPLENMDSSLLRDLTLRGPNQYYKILKKINQCPVCSPELYSLSRNLPYAQLITSIYNNPFRLPNGNIYPFDKLLNAEGKVERESLVRNGKVRDPLTHEIFFIDDCARVFPA